MISGIKEWASSLLCVGIFAAIIELILPKGNVKKYIYVVIGVVTIITVISPLISNIQYESLAKEAMSAINKTEQESNQTESINEEEYLDYQVNMVKSEYLNSLKKDMWTRIANKGAILESIEVIIDEEYNISNINIVVQDINGSQFLNNKEICKYINQEYDIDINRISVTGGEK